MSMAAGTSVERHDGGPSDTPCLPSSSRVFLLVWLLHPEASLLASSTSLRQRGLVVEVIRTGEDLLQEPDRRQP
jgi:hypothetical protein